MSKYVRLFGESIIGLFGKLFCGGVDKNSLIKELAKMRVRNDPMARVMGFDECMVDSLSGMGLAGLPEWVSVGVKSLQVVR